MVQEMSGLKVSTELWRVNKPIHTERPAGAEGM